MTIKQRFQFLNTLGFKLEDKGMSKARQTHKVARAIIIMYAIKMMNMPTFGQKFTMSLFPHPNMMFNIASTVCSRVFWFIYLQILPIFSVFNNFAFVSRPFCAWYTSKIYSVAWATSLSAMVGYYFPTILTMRAGSTFVSSIDESPFLQLFRIEIFPSLRTTIFYTTVQAMLPLAQWTQFYTGSCSHKFFTAVITSQHFIHAFIVPQLDSISPYRFVEVKC